MSKKKPAKTKTAKKTPVKSKNTKSNLGQAVNKWELSLQKIGDFSLKTELEKAVTSGNYDPKDFNQMLAAVSGEHSKLAGSKGINLAFFKNIYTKAMDPQNLKTITDEQKENVIEACKVIYKRSKGHISESVHKANLKQLSGLEEIRVSTQNGKQVLQKSGKSNVKTSKKPLPANSFNPNKSQQSDLEADPQIVTKTPLVTRIKRFFSKEGRA